MNKRYLLIVFGIVVLGALTYVGWGAFQTLTCQELHIADASLEREIFRRIEQPAEVYY